MDFIWTLSEQKVSKVVLSGGLPDNPGELVYTVYDDWNCDAWHRGFNNFHPAGQYVVGEARPIWLRDYFTDNFALVILIVIVLTVHKKWLS